MQENGDKPCVFQQGSANNDVLNKAIELGLKYKNSCVFLYHQNAGFPHNFHRLINKVLRIDMYYYFIKSFTLTSGW